MKAFRMAFMLVFALAIGLFSCQPENVTPGEETSGPSIGALEEEPHPVLSKICSYQDTIWLADEATGSLDVNYCGLFPCSGPQPKWGYVEFYNGLDSITTQEYMVMNFTMAIGWYLDIQRSAFDLAQNFSFDVNGVPIIDGDWLGNNIDPLRNQWQLKVPIGDVPQPCFEMGLNLEAVKVNFFGSVDLASRTTLWGYNASWNDPNDPKASSSPYLTGHCLASCVDGPDTLTVTQGDCNKCFSEVSVTFNGCTSADVYSVCKDLSNLVVGFSDCTTVKYDNLTGQSFHIDGNGSTISAVWVKTGCNASGICPGCGTQFDNPNPECAVDPNCTYVFN